MKITLGFAACSLLLVAGQLGAGDKGQDGKFEAAKLVGKWKYVSGVKNGEKFDEERLKKQELVIDKEKFTLKTDDATFVMKYELDEKAKPIGIKLEITDGPFGVGAKAVGIIELKGDDFTICYDPAGNDAPKAFEAKDGSKMHLFTLKRTK
jgi:uncharacterized protein (TIGR03067 family)